MYALFSDPGQAPALPVTAPAPCADPFLEPPCTPSADCLEPADEMS